MSEPLHPSDPCYLMLENGRKEQEETPEKFAWRSKPSVYREGCYICEDPEFSLMGMPLCFPCDECGGHVAADDIKCDDCGHEHHCEPLSEEEIDDIVDEVKRRDGLLS